MSASANLDWRYGTPPVRPWKRRYRLLAEQRPSIRQQGHRVPALKERHSDVIGCTRSGDLPLVVVTSTGLPVARPEGTYLWMKHAGLLIG